nr:reverse transcriptase domain-containing protein [Tanacetum cinerariifolium]
MPPRMTTQSAVWATAAPLEGRTGGQTGRGGGRTKGRSGDHGNGRIDGQGGQVGGQVCSIVNALAGRLLVVYDLVVMTPRALVHTGNKSSGDARSCKALTWGNSQIHTRIREAAVGMSWEDFKTLTREEFFLSNEMQKLETELWNLAMVEAGHAAYTDRFHQLARTLRREEMGENLLRIGIGEMITSELGLEMLLLQLHTLLGERTRVESGLEARGNHQNEIMVVNGGQGCGNNGNQARRKAFMLGAEEAFQDLNIMT